MKTTTTTQVTHYEVQKKRRESLLDEWKGYHKTVIKRSDVVMHDAPGRRMRSGVYAGYDGDRPTKNLDATLHELPPHTTTTVHRHSWDAIEFIESGSGWTEIDGQRIDWRPWDTLHLPSWAWHRHGNDGDVPRRRQRQRAWPRKRRMASRRFSFPPTVLHSPSAASLLPPGSRNACTPWTMS